MLEEEATLVESTEKSKHKEAPREDDADCWPSKKAKGKQLVRY